LLFLSREKFASKILQSRINCQQCAARFASKSRISFTPGFGPVITRQKDSGTVSMVFLFTGVTEASEYKEVASLAAKENR
jgi:hypothetical protein